MAKPIQDPVLGALTFDNEGVAEVVLQSDAGEFMVYVACDGTPDAAEIAMCTGPLGDLAGLSDECLAAMADAMEVLQEYAENNGVALPEAGDDLEDRLAELFAMKDAGVYPEEEEEVLKVDFVALDDTDTEIESEDVICVTFDRDGDVIEVSMER